jgi:hypothetical protein
MELFMGILFCVTTFLGVRKVYIWIGTFWKILCLKYIVYLKSFLINKLLFVQNNTFCLPSIMAVKYRELPELPG